MEDFLMKFLWKLFQISLHIESEGEFNLIEFLFPISLNSDLLRSQCVCNLIFLLLSPYW
jgi:hypothetical protein